VIQQAIGIIRARTGVSTDDGFDRLRQISQSEHTKLHVVAQQLVGEAVRRAHARHSPTQRPLMTRILGTYDDGM
jgi:ANTAR domain